MTRVQTRRWSCAWLELAIIVAILTNGACAPKNASFATITTVTKRLWQVAMRYTTFSDSDGNNCAAKKFVSETIQMVGEMLVNLGRVIPLSEVFQQPPKLFK